MTTDAEPPGLTSPELADALGAVLRPLARLCAERGRSPSPPSSSSRHSSMRHAVAMPTRADAG